MKGHLQLKLSLLGKHIKCENFDFTVLPVNLGVNLGGDVLLLQRLLVYKAPENSMLGQNALTQPWMIILSEDTLVLTERTYFTTCAGW